MRILIHTDDPEIALPLTKRLEVEGLSYAFFQSGQDIETPTSENPVVVVHFSPVLFQDNLYYTAPLWKKFFDREREKRYHRIRLVVAGYEKLEAVNYLCLLDLPEKLSDYLTAAQPCSEPWHPASTIGTDIQGLLRRFYVGHGKDSVIAAFDKIARSVRDIDKYKTSMTLKQLTDPEQGLYEPASLTETWCTFRTRWGYFSPLVPLLPFSAAFSTLDTLIHRAEPFFLSGSNDLQLFADSHTTQHILDIKTILEDYIAYVNAT